MPRCFISVDLDDREVLNKITEIQESLSMDGIRPIYRENLHFTLKFLGDIGDEQVELISKRLSTILQFPQFKIELAGIGVFPNLNHINVIWVGSTGTELINLAQAVRERTAGLGDDKEFVPHLTIARVKWVKNREELVRKIQNLRNVTIGSIKVAEFRLKQSLLNEDAPIYRTIGSYPLREA